MAQPPDYTHLAGLFGALAHPVRLHVILAMSEVAPRDGLSPVAHWRATGAPSLSVVAYHFRELADAGLIEEVRTLPRRGANEHFYALTERGREALALLP